MTGRVVDVFGKPVTGMRVYVLPRRGRAYRSKTDKDGRYSVKVSTLGTHGVVIAIGKAHTFRTVIVKRGATNTLDIDIDLDVDGGEVIRIDDTKRPKPKVAAQSKRDTRVSLPYSDEAVTRDAWARAWLLLDVDETGAVIRLKLLKRPGFNLEKICIEEAFKLRFDPARDPTGKPIKTYMLYTMEWPSWGWLVQGNGTAMGRPKDSDELHVHSHNITHGVTEELPILGPVQSIPGKNNAADSEGLVQKPMRSGGERASPLASATAFPQALARVPCWGSGPLNLDLDNRAYRDCSQPNLTRSEWLPWITRDTAATAIEEMAAPDLIVVEEGPEKSNTPGYIAAGTTGVLAGAAVLSFVMYNRYHSRVAKHGVISILEDDQIANDRNARDRWKTIGIGAVISTVLAGGATLFLWNFDEQKFSVEPNLSGYGGTASFTMSW